MKPTSVGRPAFSGARLVELGIEARSVTATLSELATDGPQVGEDAFEDCRLQELDPQ
jgi:hypothetical protein